jgi:hypothetical protein
MIVWRGAGILVIVFALFGAFVGQVIGQSLLHWRDASGLVGLGLIVVGAPLVWWRGRALNRRAGRVLVDPATGRPVVLRTTHSLFFLEMEYWAVVLVVIGILGMLGIMHLDLRP